MKQADRNIGQSKIKGLTDYKGRNPTGHNTRFMPAAGDRLKCSLVLLTSFRTRGTNSASKTAAVINPKRCVPYHSDKMDRENIDDFFIQADNGQIYLKIDQAFGFPTDTCNWGGYDTQSRIEIKSANYSVSGQVYISTGNIYNFFRQFEECYKTLKGTATLESYEKNLLITLDFDGLGHVKITGTFNEMHDLNKLDFEMKTDQTFLADTLDSLTKIYQKFGDNKGVTRK